MQHRLEWCYRPPELIEQRQFGRRNPAKSFIARFILSLETSTINDLPPVSPPSGRFLAQLFLVPGLIVAVAVGILWLFSWLVGSSRTPEQFLAGLRNPTSDVRWRAANDLAQVLHRDPSLGLNPHFTLDLCDLLDETLDKAAKEHAARASHPPSDNPEDRDPSPTERFVQFLMNCIGGCSIPAGIPTLSKLALKPGDGAYERFRVRQPVAVWALANLGDRLNQLDHLSAEQMAELRKGVEEEVVKSKGSRLTYATLCRDYLKHRASDGAQALGVDKVLCECAKAEDPLLRKMAAFALNIWRGDPAENDRMESALVLLSGDSGRGAGTEAVLRGLEIRYKAVEGLARRGSLRTTTRLSVLAEMLDEDRQRHNFEHLDQHGAVIVDDQAVTSTLIGALRATAELHRQRPQIDLSLLRPCIERLSRSANAYVRTEAERARAICNTDKSDTVSGRS